jgi:hypothetical protein
MRLASLFLVPAFALSLAAQADLGRMKKDLNYLAGPACEGRGTGEKGQKVAASYIAKRMKENGLKPLKAKGMGGESPYHFKYELERVSLDLEKSGFQIGDRTLAMGTQSMAFLQKDAEGEAMLLGYGIKSPEIGWDDYAGVDVKGKWVVVFQGQPAATEGPFKENPRHPAALSSAKLKAALEAGALGIITIQGNRPNDDDLKKNMGRILGFISEPRLQAKGGHLPFNFPPTGQIFKEGREAIAAQVDPLQKSIDETAKPQPAKSLGVWKFHLEQKKDIVPTCNLVGLVPGTDPVLKKEIIIVSAHHDHLGIHEGKVFYGADDNGSGTTGIIELSRLVAHSKPKRTILFLSVSGEENGLLGSEAFIANPPVDLARVKADINLDMIGRGKDEELHVTPAKIDGAVTTLTLEARKAAEKRGIALGAGAEMYWQRSDHYNFVKKGIPAMFFFAGMHEDYHQATDTVDKINFPKMARIVDLTRDIVLAVANAKEAPKPVAKEVYEAWTWASSATASEPRAAGF